MKLVITGHTVSGILGLATSMGAVLGVTPERDGIVIELESEDGYNVGRQAADLESELRANYDTSITVERRGNLA